MKKAPWMQLSQIGDPLLPNSVEQQLSQYRRHRWVKCRTETRREEELRYRTRVKEWLGLPENRWCRVYWLLLNRRVPATQCHHYQGRRGMLLNYEPFWIPVSWEGHRLD